MKKTYMIPALDVVEINTSSQLLSGSNTLGIGADGNANDAESREADFPFWLLDE